MQDLENHINVLVLENPTIFSKMIKELLEQKEGYDGEFILSEKNELVKINSYIEIITDIFNLDFNSKKIINKIYNTLKENTNLDLIEQTQNLYKEINIFISHLIQYSDYALTYDENIDIANIFKICNLKIDIDAKNLLEQVVNYISLHTAIFNTKIFVFINLKCMLCEKELLQLYKNVSYEKIHILLIENNFKNIIQPYEKVFILDNDMCELY